MHSSCLCGRVAWEIDGPLQFMSHCHCSRCRKAHGTGYATLVAGPASGFSLSGAEHVVTWASSAELTRSFCSGCGSVVPSGEWQGLVFVPAGNADDDPQARPTAHIFVASKAAWDEIGDDLPRFDAYPPGVDVPVLPDPPSVDVAVSEGKVHGSCLCGSVAFVLDSAPLRSHHCHCGRCRKARSALHASNLFTLVDGVRFLCGADKLGSYSPPDAQFFAQVFCRTCGAKMPHLDRKRGIALVPMGGLPWVEIRDSLPQFAERASY